MAADDGDTSNKRNLPTCSTNAATEQRSIARSTALEFADGRDTREIKTATSRGDGKTHSSPAN